MVEIEEMPTKRVIVHEIHKYGSKEELVRRIAGPIGAGPIFWCDGVLFVFYMDESDEAKLEYLKGIMHWDNFAYAEMPVFKETVELDEGMFKGAKVMVMDYSKFQPYKDFVKWLKSRKA